ncbi:MAG: respiratory nitrate reductase subunit gamma [Nitrospinae bacterium]|nr:respiratory nitrate reductase subunit gamma [Nitrospinota bacterium]
MTALSAAFTVLSYCAAGVFFGGLLFQLWGYATTPSPLKIPVTPHPTTAAGVVKKNIIALATFGSLFKGNRWTWIGGYAFHVILIFVFVRHLRLFINPVPPLLAEIQPVALLGAMLLPLPLIYLWVRRKAVDRYDYISSPADHFALALLLLIGLTGLALKFVAHSDVVRIKEFLLGLVMLSPVEIPAHPVFLCHFSLVLILAIFFPFSKLLHAGGVFFTPTRVQVDNPRESRHINPWGN